MKYSDLSPEDRALIDEAIEAEEYVTARALSNSRHNHTCGCGSRWPVSELLGQNSPILEAVQSIAKSLQN